MTRDDKRKAYLKSESCHMCGQVLGAGRAYRLTVTGENQVSTGCCSAPVVTMVTEQCTVVTPVTVIVIYISIN